jgi:mitogen-activated protein kinase kinase kinase kinase 1
VSTRMGDTERLVTFGAVILYPSCKRFLVGITAIELAELCPPHYELSPMRVLHLLAKSSYKPPKLKDKKKWYHLFLNLVDS